MTDNVILFLKNIDSKIVSTKPDNTSIKVSIIGRPNTGKSTLLNTLLNSDVRIVDDQPGTTRDFQEYEINYKNKLYKFVDTAGLKQKTKFKDDIEYYSYIRTNSAIDLTDIILLLIDPIIGLTKLDMQISEYLYSKGKCIIFVINKILDDYL